jgi:hypothetical protein
MKNSNEWDASSLNREIERQKALKALEKAKMIKRKVVYLPMGATGSIKYNNFV